MAPSIGLNLRVTGYCNQGGRKYMEDVFSVAYQQTEDEKDLEYAYFGIFDGHGGREAAVFAKEHLMDFIVRQKGFWSEDDETVLRAIHEGFVQTHHAMWKELDKWPRTASGLPSTAGTTASIAFIRRGKIYIGHVGDSAIVLGTQEPKSDKWDGKFLTRDHKPECDEESQRIQRSGGKVVSKSGVPRVVWNRPKMGHKGPVRRSTHIDEIPFLAVARSLGDLWSYNSEEDAFIVSPEPDTFCYNIDISKHRCLVLGTDGCWNMLTAQMAVDEVCSVEKSNEHHMLVGPSGGCTWINPSKRLVDRAIERWNGNNLRADNTSVVTVMLDPPGPPRAQVLKKQRELLAATSAEKGSLALVTNQEGPQRPPNSGFSIISRFPNAASLKERNLVEASKNKVLHDFLRPSQLSRLSNSYKINNKNPGSMCDSTSSEDTASTVSLPSVSDRACSSNSKDIQCNEISSSHVENTPKLSRELSALQLSRRARKDSNSDTENEAPPNPHFLRSKEAKVKKSNTLNLPISASNVNSSPTTVMSLRPRPKSVSNTSTTPNRKRKQEFKSEEQATKSPRMMQNKPVMTRSRTARVLQLKK